MPHSARKTIVQLFYANIQYFKVGFCSLEPEVEWMQIVGKQGKEKEFEKKQDPVHQNWSMNSGFVLWIEKFSG